MDKELVDKCLRKVPIEIRIPIKKLKNDQIWAVYIALMNKNPKFYSQLEEQFKANPNELSRALKALVDGGLIDRKAERFRDVGNAKKIFYSPTPLGIKFYDTLFDIIVPTGLILQDQKLQKSVVNDWSSSGGKGQPPVDFASRSQQNPGICTYSGSNRTTNRYESKVREE